MADIPGLIQYLAESGAFNQIVNNPMGQFGTRERNYLGAQILPERLVPNNDFTEEAISYRTVVANDGTRYSPVQLKNSTLVGAMKVSLGHQDIGSELKAADYDALIRLLEISGGRQGVMGGGVTRPGMTAESQVLQWADRTLNRPLIERIEQQRWQAIVNASVVRTGDNGYSETVVYPNPTGHRVTAGGAWSGNYDPYLDIMAGAELLSGKGFNVTRMVFGTDVRSILSLNSFMKARTGKIVVNGSGAAVNQPAGRVTLAELNGTFGTDGLPAAQTYDLQTRTQTSSSYFFPRGTMVLMATTGRDEAIDRGDLEPLVLPDTLGYAAVGRAAGQSGPGRVIKTESFERKPPRIEGEGWQASLPVITEPEAIFVISGIA